MCQSERGVKVFTPLSTRPSTGKELCGWVRMAGTGSPVSGDHGRTLNRSMTCYAAAAAAAKSLQSCPTLCDPMDSSPPGSSVPGILQARTLEWVAIAFSSA